MTTIRFKEVSVKGVRRWADGGKRKQETKVFMQTLNPFNKGADGLPKSREQILEEVRRERDIWLSGPTPDPESTARKCGCPHGCKRECDDQARCPFCWNGGKGCPVLFHGGADPERGEK